MTKHFISWLNTNYPHFPESHVEHRCCDQLDAFSFPICHEVIISEKIWTLCWHCSKHMSRIGISQLKMSKLWLLKASGPFLILLSRINFYLNFIFSFLFFTIVWTLCKAHKAAVYALHLCLLLLLLREKFVQMIGLTNHTRRLKKQIKWTKRLFTSNYSIGGGHSRDDVFDDTLIRRQTY